MLTSNSPNTPPTTLPGVPTSHRGWYQEELWYPQAYLGYFRKLLNLLGQTWTFSLASPRSSTTMATEAMGSPSTGAVPWRWPRSLGKSWKKGICSGCHHPTSEDASDLRLPHKNSLLPSANYSSHPLLTPPPPLTPFCKKHKVRGNHKVNS